MNTNIIESYKWLTPEFAITPTDGKTVKIRGKAIPRETISRNNRKYVDEELRKAARTFIDTPITENHKAWNDKKNQLGKVNWMEYDDGSMEYVAEVWNPEMAAELRAYAKNPQTSRIRGVSVEADYLKIACTKCKQEFLTEQAWRQHMETVEHIHDLPLEPHGIRGRALSIVTGRESPGVAGNTLEVMETASPLLQLLETVIKLSKEKENMNINTQVKTEVQNPPYPVAPLKEAMEEPKKEEKTYGSMDECVKAGHSKEECIQMMGKEDSEKPQDNAVTETIKITVKEATAIGKLVYEEETCTPFEQCVKDGGTPEECAKQFKETMKRNNSNKAIVETINEILEFIASPFVAEVPVWGQKIDRVQKDVENRLCSVASEIITVTNQWSSKVNEILTLIDAIPKDEWKQPLTEALAALPKDDLGWKDIKPYDDTALKEAIEAIPKDDLGWKEIKPYDDTAIKEALTAIPKDEWKQPLQEAIADIKPYDDTEIKTLLETTTKTLTEKLDQTTQKIQTIETDNLKVKETFEQLLNQADKNITEVKKTLEEREKELAETKKKLEETDKTLKETTAKAEQAKVLAENVDDKQQATFKAKAKTVVADKTTPSSFNPYDPARKP